MKNKKIVSVFVFLFVFIIIGGYILINHIKSKEQKEVLEYIPEQEITEEQSRQTIVSLYFVDKETGNLYPEARLVDIKEMLNLPYDKLISLLIEGPKNEKLKKVIPENTKLLKCDIKEDCLILDFSADILNYNKDDKMERENLIYSIVNTMTELTEINKVKFLINEEEVDEFNGTFIRK